MTIQALKRKKQELLASQVSRIASDTNENLLRVNLSKFFTDLEHEIQSALLEYWNDHMLLQGQVNLILASIHEKHQEYYELIMKHKLQEFHRAEAMGRRLVKRQEQSAMKASKPVKMTANRDNLFGTLQYSEDRLAQHTFTASENTLNRVDSNINEILLDGYKSGVGINEVSRQITERFDQLRTWEAKRIARTEIHTAQNMGVMNSYESLGVEYTQWIAASDDRTRESHIEVDREIIPIGSTYSNGLQYPGDTSGPIEEWINCRCSNAPFVMPAGMMAPSFSPFREEDLVPIETQPVQPTEPQPVEEPQTPKTNLQNLSEREQKRYQSTLKEIEKNTAKLNKLKKGDPRRLMYEAQLKYAHRTIKELEQKAKTPSKAKPKKPQYPIEVETPQQAIELQKQLQAKSVKSETIKTPNNFIRTFDIYEFDGYSIAMDRELMESKNVLTVKEMRDHINSLPEPLRTTGVKIHMDNIWNPEAAGEYYGDFHEIHMYNNGNRVRMDSDFMKDTKHTMLDGLTHEVAHAYDLKKYDYHAFKGNIATKEVWGKLCKADDKLYRYRDKITGRMRTPRTFPTGYASESWYKASRSSNYDAKARQYCEDFAESTKLYLNPLTHKEFVKQYPNRAKFLEQHFGKPNFKNYIVHTIKEVA